MSAPDFSSAASKKARSTKTKQAAALEGRRTTRRLPLDLYPADDQALARMAAEYDVPQNRLLRQAIRWLDQHPDELAEIASAARQF